MRTKSAATKTLITRVLSSFPSAYLLITAIVTKDKIVVKNTAAIPLGKAKAIIAKATNIHQDVKSLSIIESYLFSSRKTRLFSRQSASKLALLKVFIASRGEQTIGSCTLNDVLRRSGISVSFLNSFIKFQ